MKEEKEIYVYYDKEDFEYKEIDGKYLENAKELEKYFGHSIKYNLNEDKELVIYKLIKHKVFKKEFKFV